MKATLTYAWLMLKRAARDKTALFFTIVFPLIFLVIFGSLYKNNDVNFNVAVINHANSAFATDFLRNFDSSENKTFKITKTSDFATAKDKMNRGEYNSIIEIPANFGEVDQTACVQNREKCLPSGQMTVYYDEAQPQAGQTVANIMSGIMTEMNQQMTNFTPPLTVAQKSTGAKGLTTFDYIFAGLIAYALMTMSLFGLPQQLPSEKKTGVLRRVRSTPFRGSQVIVGTVLYYSVLCLISTLLVVLVGIWLFGFQMRGSWLIFWPFCILSSLMLSGIGMIFAAFAKNEKQAAPLAMMVAFPMMFLSGIFFPTFMMAPWMQEVAKFIPLSSVGDGVRAIITENAGFGQILPQIGIIAGFALVAYFISFRVFRWGDDAE